MRRPFSSWEAAALAAHAAQPAGRVHRLKDEPAPKRFVYVPPPKPPKPLSKTALSRNTPPNRRKPNETLDAFRARTQKDKTC